MRLPWLFVCLAAVGSAAGWAEEFREFAEFRYLSPLPGGAFGVTPEGRVGFDGALQVNIPVAYTPGRGNFVTGYWSGATAEWRVRFGTEGPNVNGSGLIAAGLGQAPHSLYVAFMPTSKESEAAWSAQLQLTPDRWDKPAFAIGCQDWANQRDRRPGHPGGSRSFYGVLTGRRGTEDKFVFITLGYGNGRFNNRPFGGVSWPCAKRWTVFAEYDGFNANVGVAHSFHSRFDQRRWNIVSTVALVDCSRFTTGAALTYSR
jgi:hypothetical protein